MSVAGVGVFQISVPCINEKLYRCNIHSKVHFFNSEPFFSGLVSRTKKPVKTAYIETAAMNMNTAQ